MSKKIKLTDEEWRQKLTPEQYDICRQKGTERPFTGKYTDCKDEGTYHCICCGTHLFDSKTKFDSGSGWPSFRQTVDADCISEHFDNSHGMRRVEITCTTCDAHIGHVFEDGPQPTGLRYCVNSTSLNLKSKK